MLDFTKCPEEIYEYIYLAFVLAFIICVVKSYYAVQKKKVIISLVFSYLLNQVHLLPSNIFCVVQRSFCDNFLKLSKRNRRT
jgi:hypothetical protein